MEPLMCIHCGNVGTTDRLPNCGEEDCPAKAFGAVATSLPIAAPKGAEPSDVGHDLADQHDDALTAPAELWLQIDIESADVDDCTWCRDKINNTDVRYLRADLAASPSTPAAVPELTEERIFQLMESCDMSMDCTDAAFLFARAIEREIRSPAVVRQVEAGSGAPTRPPSAWLDKFGEPHRRRQDAYEPGDEFKGEPLYTAAALGVGSSRRQYYYRMTGCPAKHADDSACICWHDEGSGPQKHADPATLSWRTVPAGVREGSNG